MRLAVIPARGGSKRIPRKNVREFCGRPIIAWSIEAAHAAGCFDRVIVSTDDPAIASVAVALGAEAPFVRPAELSDDVTGTIPVMAHAAQQCGLGAGDLLCWRSEVVHCSSGVALCVRARVLIIAMHCFSDGVLLPRPAHQSSPRLSSRLQSELCGGVQPLRSAGA